MRRTTTSAGRGSLILSSSATASSNADDDEKDGKLRHHDHNRILQVGGYLGFLSLIFIVAIVKLRHNPSYKRSIRRGSSLAGVNITQQESSSLARVPVNSIYRLSVETASGELEPLQKYAGMVSLVVNVASE